MCSLSSTATFPPFMVAVFLYVIFLLTCSLIMLMTSPGRCVRFGWQIDMFAGYSATTPSLWAMMGYDGMVIR